jgi:putative RNA 2'-phosphotransferase
MIKIDKRLDRISRIIIKSLRHTPDLLGIKVDKMGWTDVNKLLTLSGITLDELITIVELNDKQRFGFNSDKTKIRANQGHSIEVDLGLTEVTPIKLYHGTSYKYLPSIKEGGIVKGKRHHVHLSDNTETAFKVGSRHGNPVVIEIDVETMIKDGIKFFISDNSVYLTDYINPKYLKL